MKSVNLKGFMMMAFILGSLLFMSCNKGLPLIEEELKPEFTKMTLAEFAAFVDTEEERVFFTENKIIDNKEIAKMALLERETNPKFLPISIQVKFRWWFGCKFPLGICLIISFPYADFAPAEYVKLSDHIVLFPLSEENGLTTDGYLPIGEDIHIDENTIIKAGIYTAFFDEDLGEYTAIAIDLK